MDPNVFVSIVSVAVAVISTWLAWNFGRRAEFALADWLSELRTWASDSIDALAAARAVINAAVAPESASSQDRLNCITRLSALVDRGRFFLPNQPSHSKDDLSKPLAYRGWRHAALDPLVAAICVLDGTTTVSNPPRVIFELQREFVSEVYRVLRPECYSRQIARLIRGSISSREKDPSVGGLLPGGETPRGAAAVLRQVIARIDTEEKKENAR